VTVIDANTLQFGDGTRTQAAGVTDAPDLDQNAMIDGKLYPCGKEAAEFLKKLIGDRPVSFYAFGDRLERDAQNRLRGSCFIDDTSLGAELVRHGWALAHHSGVTPYEVFAREKKRGLWRGEFVIPELWRKGQRLPGEPPEVEAERQAFAALAEFKPAVKLPFQAIALAGPPQPDRCDGPADAMVHALTSMGLIIGLAVPAARPHRSDKPGTSSSRETGNWQL
jgi:endonuclease YncB( thermonuclease family)